jgi:hypothetical protein
MTIGNRYKNKASLQSLLGGFKPKPYHNSKFTLTMGQT